VRAIAEWWGVRVDVSTLGRLGVDELTAAAPHLAYAWRVPQVRGAQVRPGLVRLRALLHDPLTQPTTWNEPANPGAELSTQCSACGRHAIFGLTCGIGSRPDPAREYPATTFAGGLSGCGGGEAPAGDRRRIPLDTLGGPVDRPARSTRCRRVWTRCLEMSTIGRVIRGRRGSCSGTARSIPSSPPGPTTRPPGGRPSSRRYGSPPVASTGGVGPNSQSEYLRREDCVCGAEQSDLSLKSAMTGGGYRRSLEWLCLRRYPND
jgi:hypothetical protein